jgi:monoamine oxidase
LIKDTYFFNNKHYTEAELVNEFSAYVSKIEIDVRQIEEENEIAIEKFDHISIEKYLKDKGINGWLFDMLIAAFTGEYGLDASEQSSLNLLYMLETETSDGFKVYGDSDERYRIKGGNELLTRKLTEKISSRILMDHQCISIDENQGSFNLNFKNGDSYSAQYLIVAIPFTALRKIDIKVKLPDIKTKAIQELGYGTNSKIIFGFTERVWRKSTYSGYLFHKNIHNGWDSSELQNDNKGNGGYTIFVGGKKGKALTEADSDSYLAELNNIFPGSKDKINRKKAIFNWSTSSLVEGSYSAYKVGQWSTIAGNEQSPVGNIFFAGEHCSADFQGYMNGGAETGRVAAEGILKSLSMSLK